MTRSPTRSSPLGTWLRGPLPGLDPSLMPTAHALVQAREETTAQFGTTRKIARGLRLAAPMEGTGT
jgi:hypothetical protein